jgi:hypothetical protein
MNAAILKAYCSRPGLPENAQSFVRAIYQHLNGAHAFRRWINTVLMPEGMHEVEQRRVVLYNDELSHFQSAFQAFIDRLAQEARELEEPRGANQLRITLRIVGIRPRWVRPNEEEEGGAPSLVIDVRYMMRVQAVAPAFQAFPAVDLPQS